MTEYRVVVYVNAEDEETARDYTGSCDESKVGFICVESVDEV